MKELLEFILSELVSKPEEVKIEEQTKGGQTDFVVHVSPDDFGAVIGRGGRVANSIRTVVRTKARKLNKRVNIRFE